MFTWDNYRADASTWQRDVQKAREERDPLAHFLTVVDRMFYAASAGLLACLAMLIIA